MMKGKDHTFIRYVQIVFILIFFLTGCARKTSTPTPGITETPPVGKGAATSTSAPLPSLTSPAPTKTLEPTAPAKTETQAPPGGAGIGPENASSLELLLEVEQPGATQLAWISSDEIALAGGIQIQIYDLTRSEALNSTTAMTTTLLDSSPDGLWLASAGLNSQVGVWSLPDLAQVYTFTYAADYATGMAFSEDSQILAVSSDQQVNLWNLANGELDQTIETGYIPVVAGFSPDSSQLAVVEPNDFRLRMLSLPGGEVQKEFAWTEHASPVLYSANLSPDWRSLAWVTRGTIQLQDVETGDFGPMLSHEDFISAFAWAPSGNLLASTTGGTIQGQFVDLVYLWDPNTGVEVNHLVLPEGAIDVEFSPDGQKLAALTNQGRLMVWVVSQ